MSITGPKKDVKVRYFEGIEIGAVSVKWVRRTSDGETLADVRQHSGDPRRTVQQIISEHEKASLSSLVVTGHTARNLLNSPYRSEAECLEKALAFHGIEPDILLSLGGETFNVYPMKNGFVKNIISTSKCAAGTGEFIVQQFQRMGFSLEEGLEQSQKGKCVNLSTRCSVHCKSDATHKLNKGECNPSDIAKSLVHDLAKKVADMVNASQSNTKKMVISGGLSKNTVFIENLKQIFKDSDVITLPESHYLEAFGAALYASEEHGYQNDTDQDKLYKSSVFGFETLPPLAEAEHLLDYRVQRGETKTIKEGGTYILGVDAGSTTTKAVLLNVSDKNVDASCYLRTLGNPVLAVQNCLNDFIEKTKGKSIRIIQAGVTGSAREMVSVFLNGCLSFNEIIAHAKASAEELQDIDTVFEIGGQDSKFISFLKGIPVDYAMNEGCSAGTGSFLEESAFVDMGIPVSELSAVAEASENPIAFGERCAAFINTDLRSALQQGALRNDVAAGLVYSIADNYISRIIGPRNIGENLLFQGGVALNKAVALAMASRTGMKVIVPRYPELMGCVGASLMALGRLKDNSVSEQIFKLEELVQGSMNVKETFTCKACEDECDIQRIVVRNRIYPFGGHCSKYETLRRTGKDKETGHDFIAERNKIMFDQFGPKDLSNPRGTIGLPMTLTTYDLFPFYSKLINELGYNVVLSKPSKKGNSKAVVETCYPCKIAHGAVYDLLEKNVDHILLPRLIEMEIPKDRDRSLTCTSTSSIPDIVGAAFTNASDKIISPHMGFSDHTFNTTINEIVKLGQVLGVNDEKARNAGYAAFDHYKEFKESYRHFADKVMKEISNEEAVFTAGRSYVTCSSEINISLPRKIISRGYHAVPIDMLPMIDDSTHERDAWFGTQKVSNAIAHIKHTPNHYICFVSCYSCGPDAVMYHHFRQKLEGKTFCYLEIDSHTAHAGFDTRINAFLDIIEEGKKKKKKDAKEVCYA